MSLHPGKICLSVTATLTLMFCASVFAQPRKRNRNTKARAVRIDTPARRSANSARMRVREAIGILRVASVETGKVLLHDDCDRSCLANID